MSAVGLGFGDVVVSEMLKSRMQNEPYDRDGIAVGFMTDD